MNTESTPVQKDSMKPSGENRELLFGRDLYVTQFDTDILWYSIFGKKNSPIYPSSAFSSSIQEAEDYGQKITKLALEKGALVSSLNPSKTSYPVIGYIIFTVRFLTEPKIKYFDYISRKDLVDIINKTSDNYDVSSYIPNWTSGKRRYLFHKNAYSKLTLTHIKLVRTTQIDKHTAFCIYNALAASDQLKLEHIHLINELISNGNGKSFVLDVPPIEKNLRDPFYDKYLEYKSLYLKNNKVN